MQPYQALTLEATKFLQTADHLTYNTYPVVKENKLFITITENLLNSIKKAVEAIVYYEYLYKRVDSFPREFKNQLTLFKEIARTYNFNREYMQLILDLKDIVEHRKQSPMEFARKDAFVLCTHNYSMRTLTLEKVKVYISKVKLFIDRVNKVLKT